VSGFVITRLALTTHKLNEKIWRVFAPIWINYGKRFKIGKSSFDRLLPPRYLFKKTGSQVGSRRGKLKIVLRATDKEGTPAEHELHYSRKLFKAQYSLEALNEHKQILSISADAKANVQVNFFLLLILIVEFCTKGFNIAT